LRPSRFIAIYEDQPKGESIHSQEMCLPGSRWEFKNAGKAVVQLTAPPGSTVQRFGSHRRCRVNGSTPTITVNRAVMEKGAYKQLSYFWTPANRFLFLIDKAKMKLATDPHGPTRTSLRKRLRRASG